MRRLRSTLILLLCSLTLLPGIVYAEATEPVEPASEHDSAFPTIEELAGTGLRYRIGFLWMNRVADGVFTLAPGDEPQTFSARLFGKTRGVAAWVTSSRIQSYTTLMQKRDDGRLITLTHDSSIERGKGDSKKVRVKHYVFDRATEKISVSKIADGDLWWTKDLPFEGEMPVDILTAYFNFVTGVYGPIEPGARYALPAFGGKGVGQIVIEVLTDAQRPSSSFFPAGGVLCRVKVDQEIFNTGDGTILIWYDDKGILTRGIVRDIIGMGDIRGVLRK